MRIFASVLIAQTEEKISSYIMFLIGKNLEILESQAIKHGRTNYPDSTISFSSLEVTDLIRTLIEECGGDPDKLSEICPHTNGIKSVKAFNIIDTPE